MDTGRMGGRRWGLRSQASVADERLLVGASPVVRELNRA